MTNVSLEINSLKIDSKKKRWKIYFVIVTDHPTDPDKMITTVIPDNPIRVDPSQNNLIDFDGTRPDSEGLHLMSRKLPSSKEINVHLYVRHSRVSTRKAGDILKDMSDELKNNKLDDVIDLLGTSATPWIVISKAALPIIGNILQKIPDKDMGFVSLFERFNKEFEIEEEIENEKIGGKVSVVYNWSLDRS